MSGLVTASKTGLAYFCRAWTDMPADETAPHVVEAGERGQRMHRAVEDAARFRGPVEQWMAGIPWLDDHPGPSLAVETALVLDLADPARPRAAVLGSGLDRAYGSWDGRTHVAGSADALVVREDLIIVYDLKTGRRRVRAYRNAQLKTLALTASLVHRDWLGRWPALVIGSIVQPGRRDAYGMPATWDQDPHVYPREELEEWGTLLGAALARTGQSAGWWCDKLYCPARGTCLAYEMQEER